MMFRFFRKKNKDVATGNSNNAKKASIDKEASELKSWYADRYVGIAVQRNIILLFAIVSSVAVLISLVIIKTMYDQRSIDPYLIEVEPDTGIATVVDYKAKKEYIEQEIVKEFMVVNYIKARESYNPDLKDVNLNYIRVTSTKNVYDGYKKNFSTSFRDVEQYGSNPIGIVKIKSINYLTPVRIQVRFSRIVSSEGKSKKKTYNFSTIVTFLFSDSELNLEDRWMNPFGFQVTSYIAHPESNDMYE